MTLTLSAATTAAPSHPPSFVSMDDSQQQQYFIEDEYESTSTGSYVASNRLDSPISEFSSPSLNACSCCPVPSAVAHTDMNRDASTATLQHHHPVVVAAAASAAGSSNSVYAPIPSRSSTSEPMPYGPESGEVRYMDTFDDAGSWDLLGFTPEPGTSPSPQPGSDYGSGELWPYNLSSTSSQPAPHPHHQSSPQYHHVLPPVTHSQQGPWTPTYAHTQLGMPHHQQHPLPLDPMVVDYPQGSHTSWPKTEPMSPPVTLDGYRHAKAGLPSTLAASRKRRKGSVSDSIPGTFNFVIDAPHSPMGPRDPYAVQDLSQHPSAAGMGMKPLSSTKMGMTGREGEPAVMSRRSTNNKVPQERQSVIILPSAAFTKRGYHSPKVWESHKETIRRLYLEERKPLKEVSEYMAVTYGFKATPKMYKTKFNSWGFGKNNTEKEARQILYVKLARDAQGKRSIFSRNGKQIDLPRYLRRKGVTEEDLLDLDAPGQLPPHVRCWTPPPENPATGRPGSSMAAGPGATLANKERLLGLIRAVVQNMHSTGFGRDVAETWTTCGPRTAPYLLNRYLQQAAWLGLEGKTVQAARALDASKYHLVRYAAELNPATTLALLFSCATWPDPRITRSVWRYLATRKMRRRHPLARLFAFMNEMVEGIGGGSSSSTSGMGIDGPAGDDADISDDAMDAGLISPDAAKETMYELHKLLLSVFEPVAQDIEATWGPDHPFTLSFWLQSGHACGYRDVNRYRLAIDRLPRLIASVGAAFGDDSYERWEAEVFRFTALPLLGPDAVAAEVPGIERAYAHMRGLPDRRVAPLQLTCLYMLYALHRGRSAASQHAHANQLGALGGTRRDLANHYLERYLDEKTALLGPGDGHVIDSLVEARDWHMETRDIARVADVEERLKQCEALRMLAGDGKDGDGGVDATGRRARGASKTIAAHAAHSPELATFTLQLVIRTMLF